MLLRLFATVVALLPTLACNTPGAVPAHPAEQTVALEILATGSGDAVDGTQPFVVAPGPHRGFYLSAQSTSEMVVQLDSLARFVRLIGRPGEGPGEYRDPMAVLSDSDRVLISDRLGKWHVFDSLGRFLQDIPGTVAGGRNAVLLRGDSIVVAQRISDPSKYEMPLHLIAPDGKVANSFGSTPGVTTSGHIYAFFRDLTGESDSTFWVSRLDRYHLELWSTAGRKIREFSPQREWLPPIEKDPESIDRELPPAMVLGVYRDTHGHLLVVLRRARSDWKPNPAPNRKMMDPSDGMKYIEEIVEILDSNTGKLLGSVIQRDYPLLGYLGDDRFVAIREDDEGRQQPVILRLRH